MASGLYYSVITSYDPIWYLFHSMVTYHQYIWIDCNDYDEIEADNLDDYEKAYESFCADDIDCGDMDLDGKQYIAGYFKDAEWVWIYSNELTVRKSYHLDRWNVKYDLGDGGGFFRKIWIKSIL